jgi:hypothetical protein
LSKTKPERGTKEDKRKRRGGKRPRATYVDYTRPPIVAQFPGDATTLARVEKLADHLQRRVTGAIADTVGSGGLYRVTVRIGNGLDKDQLLKETRSAIERTLRPRYSGLASLLVNRVYRGDQYLDTRVMLTVKAAEATPLRRTPHGIKLLTNTTTQIVFVFDEHQEGAKPLEAVIRRVCRKVRLQPTVSLDDLADYIHSKQYTDYLR